MSFSNLKHHDNDSNDEGSDTHDNKNVKHSNTVFQATIPGIPKHYFQNILHPCKYEIRGTPMNYPAYSFKDMKSFSCDVPDPMTTYKPTPPDPMYVSTMPWCAYPYGVPGDKHFFGNITLRKIKKLDPKPVDDSIQDLTKE